MPRKRREEEPSINLTPMIDVVFLLVIFFLAGSSFRRPESHIPIDIPGVGALQPIARGADPRIVEVNREGMILLDGQPHTLPQLAQNLSQATRSYPDVQVIVRADATGAVQQVAEVFQTARAAGVRQLGLAVQSQRR